MPTLKQMQSAISKKWLGFDNQETGEVHSEKVVHLARRQKRIREEIERLKAIDTTLMDAPDGQIFSD